VAVIAYKVAVIAYKMVKAHRAKLPLLAPMFEVVGRISLTTIHHLALCQSSNRLAPSGPYNGGYAADGQAARPSGTLISDSAGMPSSLCNRQTIRRVSGRFRLSTS
jgi:hypothetical protein